MKTPVSIIKCDLSGVFKFEEILIDETPVNVNGENSSSITISMLDDVDKAIFINNVYHDHKCHILTAPAGKGINQTLSISVKTIQTTV